MRLLQCLGYWEQSNFYHKGGNFVITCNLPVLLAERRMKVSDLVRATGMSKTTLHKLYNGQSTRIDFETLDKICDLLEVEVGDILVHTNDAHSSAE